jgi:hypothetical protein
MKKNFRLVVLSFTTHQTLVVQISKTAKEKLERINKNVMKKAIAHLKLQVLKKLKTKRLKF